MSEKKEVPLRNRPKNLHPRLVLPGQGAEPREGRSKLHPLNDAVSSREDLGVLVLLLHALNTVPALLGFAACCEALTRCYSLALRTEKETENNLSGPRQLIFSVTPKHIASNA